MIRSRLAIVVAFMLTAFAVRVGAHSGPPYPILSDQVAGAYLISVWTDPDTTDDGSPGGQFWIRFHLVDGGEVPPLLLIYLVPFVLVGLLWGRLLMRRRAMKTPSNSGN